MARNAKSYKLLCLLTLMILFTLALSLSAYGKDSGTKSSPAAAMMKKEVTEWNKVLEAAKKEGKLVLGSDPSDLYRRALVMPFEKKYPEIKVEYTGINGRDFKPRLLQERKVGQYLWDVRVSGIQPNTYEMKDQGCFDPIRSLILSEIANDSKWHGGFAYIFTDKERKYFPTAVYFAEFRVMVNRDFVSESQLISSKQLLDPQIKGKLSIQTPTTAGGLAAVTQLYMLYGANFVRDLFQKQGIIITSDKRQQVEWLTRGKYPIALGLEQGFLLEFQNKGVGLNIKSAKNSQDDSVRVVHLINKAPHPNAARVYINWVLSDEGQRELVKGMEGASMRKAVEPFDKRDSLDPLAETHKRMYEENNEIRDKVEDLVRELVK